jgi:hypothetical protein
MYTIFLVCAVVGGTVFVCQFVLTLVGIGVEEFDITGDVEVGDLDASDADFHDSHGVHDHGSTGLFGIISFRTVVAALTFFGLVGIATLSGGAGPIPSAALAVGAGFLAMLAVHHLMRLLFSLGQDKTVRIERSLGARCTVYVPIPPKREGSGKVQLRIQDRIVECIAMTPGPEKLPTGAKVVVTDIISPTTLEVEEVPEHDEDEKATA